MAEFLLPIKDRITAGQALAEALQPWAGDSHVIVLALPRGGVPVAYEIAHQLGVPLDVLNVRKLGAPRREELAMGALASGNVRTLNDEIIQSLNINESDIDEATERALAELNRREQTYRANRETLDVRNKKVILVDDGIATGATIRAAIEALRSLEPAEIILATAVAPVETIDKLSHEVDQIICLGTPEPFYAISYWYDAFPQVQDDEVVALLQRQHQNLQASEPA